VSVDAEATLRRAGECADDDIDLGEAALALASFERPLVSLDRYRDHLARLAGEVATEAFRGGGHAPDLTARIDALNTVLFEQHGYSGDSLTYDDLQNANLIRVIDRRKGLPVALGILCLATAAKLGWEMAGLSFPAHFVIRVEFAGERAILDPFNGGRRRETAELRDILKGTAGADIEIDPTYFRPVSKREVLLRLQNNILTRLLQRRQIDAAVAVIERMLLFAPALPALWREAGLLRAQTGNLLSGMAALENAMVHEQSDKARHQIALLLQELRGRIN
jgi:regulator of sirC expression with transglutaminase-like and TPR domain